MLIFADYLQANNSKEVQNYFKVINVDSTLIILLLYIYTAGLIDFNIK